MTSDHIPMSPRHEMPLVLKGLLFVYRWTVVVPILVLTVITHAGSCVLLSILGFPNFASRVVATHWARINAFFSLMKISIEGREKVDPNQSYVIVSNHRSLVDIYVMYGFSNIEFKWVMKKELRSIPIFGYACEKMGHIIVDRSNNEAALKSLREAQERIRNGISIMFFVEGTRSRDNTLLPFKKGAFRMAMDLGLPILPVSIHGTSDILPSDSVDLYPGSAQLRFHDPIPMTEDAEMDDLMQTARTVITQALEKE